MTEPGPELDEMCAHASGWVSVVGGIQHWPPYSSDVGQALALLRNWHTSDRPYSIYADSSYAVRLFDFEGDSDKEYLGLEKTLAHAICDAFLRAKGVDGV